MKPSREMIVEYAQVLNDYNAAHCEQFGFIPFTAKAHNPYMPSDDTTLNALLAFEGDLAKKFTFAIARMMKTEAILILKVKDK